VDVLEICSRIAEVLKVKVGFSEAESAENHGREWDMI
jgi:hypothetical protein